MSGLPSLDGLSPAKRELLLATLRQKAGAAADTAPTVPRRAERGEAPLSFAQQRLWFLDRLNPGDPSYTISWQGRLRGPLDGERLRASLGEIVRRHEALRTAFVERQDGEPRQVVTAFTPLPMPRLDLAGLPPAWREAEVLRLARADDSRPFRLAAAPLLRAALLRLAADEHVVLLALHHIVADGWSLEVLWRELIAVYGALAAGRPSPLPELPIQYADFAAWQRDWLHGERRERLLAHWREQLAGAPELTELPADRPRPARRGTAGAARSQALPAAVLPALRAMGAHRRTTLFAAGLAAFAALVHRHGGGRDLVIGTPIAGRDLVEIEPLIGYFVNTLPVRLELPADATGQALLDRVAAATAAAFDHQALPFELLVDQIGLERSLSHTPLFQLVFVHDAGSEAPAAGGELALLPLAVAKSTAKFDLVLELGEAPPRVTAQFAAELFDGATVQRFLGQLANLLAALPGQLDRRLDELPLLADAERHALLHELAASRREMPAAAALHRQFEHHVARAPAAAAVTCGTATVSYGELDRRANRLARHLRANGVGRGGSEAPVALVFVRGVEQVTAILAVQKAGAAYLAIEPSTPAERRALVLSDAGVTCGLTHAAAGEAAPGAGVAWIDCDRDAPAIALRDGSDLGVEPPGEALAYLLYTSGSTGRPKGVLVTHRNVTRLLAAAAERFDFAASDVWTLFHSYAFDFSVWEMWGALAAGGRLIVVSHLDSRSPERFHRLLADEGVTVLNQTPSAFRELIAAGGQHGAPRLAALRYVVFGGEALDFPSLRPWFERHGDERPLLVNMYGITETTVHVTFRAVRQADARTGAGSRIGLPLADLALYLHDRQGCLAPLGAVGEIHVGGAGLARGYLAQPDRTAERFVPHPAAASPGERLYRTGDLARWRPGAELEYLGRGDRQVKVRGFRIELGEVEAVLAAHPALAEAVVAARPGPGGAMRLICWCAGAAADSGLDAGELQAFARQSLPDYMVPAVFVLLPALPRTANGKLDRAALPAPDEGRLLAGAVRVAPRTAAERTLAAIWAEVLGVAEVGALDSFFALGGDSILSLRVLARAAQQGLAITLQQLFEHQVLADLAAAAADGAADGGTGVPPFALTAAGDRERLPHGIADAYPLSRLQMGMLFHGEMSADSALYHNVTSCRVGAAFDAAAFAAAARLLLARHPILRTSFDLASYGEPLQLVHPHAVVPLAVLDLTALSASRQESELAAWMGAEKSHPFDPLRAPLLRFHVHLLGAGRFQFGLVEHHAILDGWSVALLHTELFRRYLAAIGRGAPLAELPPGEGMREFVQLERAARLEPAAAAFWDRQLADATVTLLPRFRRRRADAGGDRVHGQAVSIAADTSAGLFRLATACRVPIKSVLLAAHLRALAHHTGNFDVLTGLVSHGRPEGAGGDRALGLFLNTLPLRQRLSPGSWDELVQAVFAGEAALLPWRRFPLYDVQARRGGESLFETAFNFVHFHAYGEAGVLPDVEIAAGEAFQQTSFTLLANFRLTLGGRAVLLDLQYDGREVGPAQIAALGETYGRVLVHLAAAATRHAGDHRHETAPLLRPAEAHAVLREHNDTAAELAGAPLLHELFEQVVAAAPESLALVAAERRLTYRELDTAAELVADLLRRHGVGAESLVAVAMERSPEMVAALLGVLKAGAAYVPLDPDLPAERLAFMLADSGAVVVLCHEATLARLPETTVPRLLLAASAGLPPAPAAARQLRWPGAGDQIAYMIYTSGSTGLPKGAPNTHRAIRNRLLWMQRRYRLDASDRVLQKTTTSFDVSVWELFWPLVAGARLVLARPGGQQDPAYLLELIREQEVTTLHFVPPMLRAFLAEPGVAGARSLRRVIVSGEALPPDLVQRFHAVFAAAAAAPELHNLYGPTEAAVDVTAWACVPGATAEPVPIGRPIANTRVLLLDRERLPVAVGAVGEIHLGGVQLARGYHRRPDLTAERFVPDPTGEAAGERLYRTGDLGRLLADGAVEFLGRVDFQVKVHGYRIELGEIEAALRRHRAIAEAAVAVRDEAGGTRRLIAYLVARGQAELPLAEITADLRAHLPAYMVPSAFVPLGELPRTASGKLDRRALPAPPLERRDTGAAYTAPETAAEATLAAIWAEVLHLDRAGIDDSLFALGGDSMLSLQILSRARREGLEFRLQDLYRHPTIRELARQIEPPPAAGDDDEDLLRLLDSLSDEEVAARLQELQAVAPREDQG